MMKLTPGNVEDFKSRFYACSDGLLLHLDMRLGGNGEKTVTLTIQVKDNARDSDDCWVKLKITVSGVLHYRFAQSSREQFQVLSDGIQIGLFANTVFLDLAPYTDEPDCENDFLRSSAYCAGSEVSWRTVA